MTKFFHLAGNNKTVFDQVFKNIQQLDVTRNSYAAFDMDNTLILHDIGEAVFAKLVKKGLITGFGWRDYLSLVSKNKLKAYKIIIDMMEGLKLRVLKEITHEVIELKTPIALEGYKIPVPHLNLQMKLILELLKQKGIVVYVVTASNEISAKIICNKFFGISESNIIGAEVPLFNNVISKGGVQEFPYAQGKTNLIKKKFGHKPLITAGDSNGDIYLLRYTDDNGIGIWLGKDSISLLNS